MFINIDIDMEEDHFAGDTGGRTFSYLDAVSRARMPEVSRSILNTEHELCRPSAQVFRAHRGVDGDCPVYASTTPQGSECCELTFNTANASDIAFLRALKHGYDHHNPPLGATWDLRRALKQVVPELYNWFHNGQANVLGASPNPTLTLNMTATWFSLVMKFYMVVRPTFNVQAHDPHANRTSLVLRDSKVFLGTLISPALRETLKECIQAVGVDSVEDFADSFGPFVPHASRCEYYHFHPGQVRGYVDVTDLASVLSNNLCGRERQCRMRFGAVAVVRQGASWVDTLVNIFLAMFRRRKEITSFFVHVYTRLVRGDHGYVMGDTDLLPDTSDPAANVQAYTQVMSTLAQKLPGEWHWRRTDITGNTDTIVKVQLTVAEDDSDYDDDDEFHICSRKSAFHLDYSRDGILNMTSTH